jgi:hypothetical protein
MPSLAGLDLNLRPSSTSSIVHAFPFPIARTIQTDLRDKTLGNKTRNLVAISDPLQRDLRRYAIDVAYRHVHECPTMAECDAARSTAIPRTVSPSVSLQYPCRDVPNLPA